MTDKEIYDLWDGGRQQAAFNAIVSEYSERIYWSVRRMVMNHDDADDIVQEIFVRIWSAFPSFRRDSSLFTWIWRIATNETLTFLRKQKVRAALQFQSLDSTIEKKIDDDPYFNGDEAQRILAKAVARLPGKQRQVFCLRYFDELPYERISEILGSSVGSLKASYHFAYEKVKSELEKHF